MESSADQPGQGFPRSVRVLDGAAFRRVFSKREMLPSRYFRVFIAPWDAPRLGLAVSRKVSKRAVDRNRIKRIVRESFRMNRATLPAMDFVVVASGPDCARVPNQVLADTMADLWRRARNRFPEPPTERGAEA